MEKNAQLERDGSRILYMYSMYLVSCTIVVPIKHLKDLNPTYIIGLLLLSLFLSLIRGICLIVTSNYKTI